jgi:hypothetical protein
MVDWFPEMFNRHSSRPRSCRPGALCSRPVDARVIVRVQRWHGLGAAAMTRRSGGCAPIAALSPSSEHSQQGSDLWRVGRDSADTDATCASGAATTSAHDRISSPPTTDALLADESLRPKRLAGPEVDANRQGVEAIWHGRTAAVKWIQDQCVSPRPSLLFCVPAFALHLMHYPSPVELGGPPSPLLSNPSYLTSLAAWPSPRGIAQRHCVSSCACAWHTLPLSPLRTHAAPTPFVPAPCCLLCPPRQSDHNVCRVRPALLAIVRALQRIHYNVDNPFLKGHHMPIKDEVHVHGLDVVGTLPPELDGVYLQTGPNAQHEPIGAHNLCAASPSVHCVVHACSTASAVG